LKRGSRVEGFMAKCKNCGKEIDKGLEFCSKECMEAYKQKAKSESTIDSEIENDLLDPSYMRGIYWRMAKLEAIHKARVKGYSEDDILRLLIRGGLTRGTAKRLIDDSRMVYGE
jgi:hypothetical protein